MRIHILKYSENGKEVERGFRDRRKAEKLKKIKGGTIRHLDVDIEVRISV
ncbi:hypothetical protein [Clostridium cylindrosporum]|uniref:Uncharacterized protein n=1 Tax=Clostridium cylindrosporum DSM 605 TaxID=1121307 RepID=A0A0J8G5S1_CLOCY|nr:hypothetical protein [Clostridium cylindrosporum]KMT22986.1 hypothetical protein CLCY_7c00330 [Clostridium cylindrosporum DSM 605]